MVGDGAEPPGEVFEQTQVFLLDGGVQRCPPGAGRACSVSAARDFLRRARSALVE